MGHRYRAKAIVTGKRRPSSAQEARIEAKRLGMIHFPDFDKLNMESY